MLNLLFGRTKHRIREISMDDVARWDDDQHIVYLR
jgi:hypothetical protein